MLNEFLLPPATKLGQGYVFTCVCDSVHRGVLSQHALQVVSQHALQQISVGGAWSWGVCSQGMPGPGGVCSRRGGPWRRPPRTATAAGGTHPTGMHSCYHLCS